MGRRKSCVLAVEVSPVSAACFDHRTVGDELCTAAVSCCDCGWPAFEADLAEARAAGCRRGHWSGRGCACVWWDASGAAADKGADGKCGVDHLGREGERYGYRSGCQDRAAV